MTAEYMFTDGQNGAYSVDPQNRPFQLEADVSRVVFGGNDGTVLQPTSDIGYTPAGSEFAPRFNQFNQLFMRGDDGQFYPVNQGNDGRFYPSNPGQVQIPSYDINPGLPCVTQPGTGYDAQTGNFQRSQLRPEDVVRIIMAVNAANGGGGNYMERGYMPSRWNNPQYSMYQPGRVPPSQVQAYNIARILLGPNACMDPRGMYPNDYPQMPCQRSNRCNPQQQWTSGQQRFNPNQRFNMSNPQTYHQLLNQVLQQQQQQQFDPRYQQQFDPRYQQQFDPRYAQQFDPRYAQQFDPRYAQQFDPRYQDYDPNYPMDYNPNYPQDCNPRYNPRFNPGCNGNSNMSQFMRYAPFLLSMLSRGGRGFPGGFQGGFPGGYGGYNQFNRFGGGGFNNFGGNNFNRYGGGRSGVGIRLGNFSFRL